MERQDIFSLVPGQPTAIEGARPSTGRVVSGMMSDALALANAAIQQQIRPLRIVVMDDEPSIVEWMRRVLERYLDGATVVGFTDANLAWQELIRETPDLFTTDIGHVGPTTSEMLRWLITNGAKHPIFVITANGTERTKLEANFLGCGLNLIFMWKPFTVEELGRNISVHLGLPAKIWKSGASK
jgi:DNA-binding NtrC family response regulator